MKWRRVKTKGWFARAEWRAKCNGWLLTVASFTNFPATDIAGYHVMARQGELVFNSAWEEVGGTIFRTPEDAMDFAEQWVGAL